MAPAVGGRTVGGEAGAHGSERSGEGFAVVGCTVSPAFAFARFELAPAGFVPANGDRPA